MSEVILTDKTFTDEVLKSAVPVLVDFWAPWCGPCRMQGPIIEELAREIDSSKGKVAKFDVEEYTDKAKEYNIMSIPSLVIFKGGQIVEQFTGVQTKDKLKSALAKHAV